MADGVVVGSAIVRVDRKQRGDETWILEAAVEAIHAKLAGGPGARRRIDDDRKRPRKSWRSSARHIDHIDLQLLALLNERTNVVEKIGAVKQEVRFRSMSRAARIRFTAMCIGHNTGPLTAEAVHRIFERIIDEMRDVQRAEDAGWRFCRNAGGRERRADPGVIDRLVELSFTVHRSTGSDAHRARRGRSGGRFRSRRISRCSKV